MADAFANQLDRFELWIDDVQARRVSQEVEDGSMFDRPPDRFSNHRQKPIQFPAARSKSTDVADGAHRNLDQSVRISKRLRIGLRGDDRIDDGTRWLLHWVRVRVRRVQAADPAIAEVE